MARSNASVVKEKVRRYCHDYHLRVFNSMRWLQGLTLRSAKFGDHDEIRFNGGELQSALPQKSS